MRQLDSESFDVILADIHMPGTDGMQFYRNIRAIDESLADRFVFITGDSLDERIAEFLAKEQRPYLNKPFESMPVGVAVVVTVAAAYVSVRSRASETALDEKWDQFYAARAAGDPKALKRVAEDHRGTPVESVARLELGNLFLQGGRLSLQSKPKDAEKFFRQAASQFEAVETSNTQEQFRQQATYSLAMTYEWMRDFEKAQATYRRVEGPYKLEARERLEYLGRESSREFYRKFSEYKPPSFDPEVPPESLRLPSFSDLETMPDFHAKFLRRRWGLETHDLMLEALGITPPARLLADPVGERTEPPNFDTWGPEVEPDDDSPTAEEPPLDESSGFTPNALNDADQSAPVKADLFESPSGDAPEEKPKRKEEP